MVDVILVVLVVGAGVLGWLRGLAVSLLAGLVFAICGLPFAAIAAAIGSPPPAAAYALGGMLGLVPFALRLQRVGDRVDGVLGQGRWRVADRVAGAVLNMGIAACVAWFVGALASIAPGDSGGLRALRASSGLASLVEAVPPQGDLGVLVLRSGLAPAVNGPLVLAEVPDERSADLAAVRDASASVLLVRGVACDQIVTGTGWVAGPGIVVTNAHVVAGTSATRLSGGPRYEGAPATVTAFDPVNDIAVLTVDEARVTLPPPLEVVPRVRHGERAVVVGYPLGGERRIVPARIDRVADYEVSPLDGSDRRAAPVLAFRARVEHGNSGGPVLDEEGAVLGLVVSKAVGQRVDAGYGVPSAQLLGAIAEGARRTPASTGPCLEPTDLEGSVGDRPGAAPRSR